jgi:glutathione S-transferase
MALKYAGIEYEHREIVLRDKPQSMLLLSPKGTVPVLCFGELILDQSLDIMRWALDVSDTDGWLEVDQFISIEWLVKNDDPFKTLLDQYKYPERYPHLNREEILNAAIELMLRPMEAALEANAYLLSNKLSWVDIAIFPFIRQFAMSDQKNFERLPLPNIQNWLGELIESELFNSVMHKHPVWID